VHKRVQVTLGRDEVDWQIRHTCPACTYKLKGEPNLMFNMLYTLDGNDSLKRIIRQGEALPSIEGEAPVLGPSSKQLDMRQGAGDYFLAREKVDVWTKEILSKILAAEGEVRPTG
jgi:hypothetical protein